MTTNISDADKSILIKSFSQMYHAITSAHYTLNGTLLGSATATSILGDPPRRHAFPGFIK